MRWRIDQEKNFLWVCDASGCLTFNLICTFSMSSSFGESVDPCAAIQAILGSYPFSVGLLRELLQNSDDARASKQVWSMNVSVMLSFTDGIKIFVLDHRTHATDYVYDPRREDQHCSPSMTRCPRRRIGQHCRTSIDHQRRWIHRRIPSISCSKICWLGCIARSESMGLASVPFTMYASPNPRSLQ